MEENADYLCWLHNNATAFVTIPSFFSLPKKSRLLVVNFYKLLVLATSMTIKSQSVFAVLLWIPGICNSQNLRQDYISSISLILPWKKIKGSHANVLRDSFHKQSMPVGNPTARYLSWEKNTWSKKFHQKSGPHHEPTNFTVKRYSAVCSTLWFKHFSETLSTLESWT